MSYWIVLDGPGEGGEPKEFSISEPFLTIDDAEDMARSLGAPGPRRITPFYEGQAAVGYRIRDEREVIVSKGIF